jgi:hypothetical protein
MSETISPEVRDYLKRIAANGGKASKGSPQRKRAAKKASIERWRRTHPKARRIPS